jgi:phenylacetate-CoA ligase
VIPMSGGQTEKQVNDHRPEAEHHHGHASYMQVLVEELVRQGSIEVHSLEVGSSARALTEAMWAEIEAAGIDAVDIYGLPEVMGPGVATDASRLRTARHLGRPLLSRDHRSRKRRGAG